MVNPASTLPVPAVWRLAISAGGRESSLGLRRRQQSGTGRVEYTVVSGGALSDRPSAIARTVTPAGECTLAGDRGAGQIDAGSDCDSGRTQKNSDSDGGPNRTYNNSDTWAGGDQRPGHTATQRCTVSSTDDRPGSDHFRDGHARPRTGSHFPAASGPTLCTVIRRLRRAGRERPQPVRSQHWWIRGGVLNS